MSRPLLITDCDEVLLHMVAHFDDWLEEDHDIDFAFETGSSPSALTDRRHRGDRWRRTGSGRCSTTSSAARCTARPWCPGRARGARPDRRSRRHRHSHQPRRRGASAGGSSNWRATASAMKSSATRAAKASGARHRRPSGDRRAPSSSTILPCTMRRSPNMRRMSGGCTWSPSLGLRRRCRGSRDAHARIDDWPTATDWILDKLSEKP